MLPAMNAACSVAGRAVGTATRSAPASRQPAHVFREFHVVADQHADLQAADARRCRPSRRRPRTAAFRSRRRGRLAVDPRAGAVDEDRAVVDRVARPARQNRHDGDAVGRGAGSQGGDLRDRRPARRARGSPRRRRSRSAPAPARSAAPRRRLSPRARRVDQREVGRDIAGLGLHLQGGEAHQSAVRRQAPSRRGRSPKRAIRPKTSAATATKKTDHRRHGRRVAVAQRVEDLDRQRLHGEADGHVGDDVFVERQHEGEGVAGDEIGQDRAAGRRSAGPCGRRRPWSRPPRPATRSIEAKPSDSVTSGSVTKKIAWLITTVQGWP